MCFSAIAGIGSAVIGGLGARKSANAQESAANDQLQLGREQLDFIRQQYREAQGRAGRSLDATNNVTNRTRRDQSNVANNFQRNALNIADNTRDARTALTGRVFQGQTDQAGETRQDQNALAVTGLERATGTADAVDARTGAAANRAFDQGTEAVGRADRNTNTAIQDNFNTQRWSSDRTRDYSIATARDARDAQVSQFQPYADRGNAAGGAYAYELGLSDRPEDYRGFEGSPGFQFALQQGLDAVEGSAAARGGLLSGRTLEGVTDFAIGTAQQDYGSHMARLGAQSDQGLNAAGSIATAEGNFGVAQGNAWQNWGNARERASDNYTGMRVGANDARATREIGLADTRAARMIDGSNVWGGANTRAGEMSDMRQGGAIDGYGVQTFNAMGNAGMAQGNNLDNYGMNSYNALSGNTDMRFNAAGTAGANTVNNFGNWAALNNNASAGAAAGMSSANNFMGNALANRGDAGAAGAVGMTNALTGGLQQGIGLSQFNAMGGWGPGGAPMSNWGGFGNPFAAPAQAPGFNGGGGMATGSRNLNGIY